MMPNSLAKRKQLLKVDISSTVLNGASPDSDMLVQVLINTLFYKYKDCHREVTEAWRKVCAYSALNSFGSRWRRCSSL